MNPYAPRLIRKVNIGKDLSKFLQYLLLFTQEMVARYRIWSPESKIEYSVPLP